MSIFSLSLLFLSPIICYATLILLKESKDPLSGFHDNYLRAIRNRNSALRSGSLNEENFDSIYVTKNRIVYLFAIGAIIVLFLAGASLTTIGFSTGALFLYRYWEKGNLSRKLKKELKDAEEEFPSIVELFAVLVSAGESPTTALLRVTEKSSGAMARNFNEALFELQNGKNLTQALEKLGNKVDSPTVRRFCDTLILAMERGTSLSEVLTRQVEEVRATHHAALLTAAGKAEIALMIPVIFLILPISVLFALWPSYISLGQSVM
jgi:tight adherence protein C